MLTFERILHPKFVPSHSWLGTFRLPCAIAFFLSVLTVAVYVSAWNEDREPLDDLTEVMIAGAIVVLWIVLTVVLAALFRKAEQSAPRSCADVEGGLGFRWSVRRLGFTRRVVWVAFAFCVLCPALSRFSATMLKDSLFTPFFLLYTIGFVEVFRSDGGALWSRRWIALRSEKEVDHVA